MTQETITLIVAVVAVIVAVYAIYKASQAGVEITPGFLQEAVLSAVPIGQDFATVAQIAVNEAEQLKRTGKIASNDEAFDHALTIAKNYLPSLTPLESAKLIAAINAAVLVASALTAQINQAKAAVESKGTLK